MFLETFASDFVSVGNKEHGPPLPSEILRDDYVDVVFVSLLCGLVGIR
jgi:hypothetical protein